MISLQLPKVVPKLILSVIFFLVANIHIILMLTDAVSHDDPKIISLD